MSKPAWTALYALAASQDGHFTTSQAADAGYSRPLLDHHVKAGRFLRIQRGIYRLRDFPSADREDLVVAWLWSDQQGVVSHETALLLHDLSDALPARVDPYLPGGSARALEWAQVATGSLRWMRTPFGLSAAMVPLLDTICPLTMTSSGLGAASRPR